MNDKRKLSLYVIDDHPEARESLQALLVAHGHAVKTFAEPEVFFENYPQHNGPGCVITDLKMLGMNGLEVVREIKRQQYPLPVIVVSAFATVAEAVQLMKAGADTLIQKPYGEWEILNAIDEAVRKHSPVKSSPTPADDLQSRFQKLTAEEILILEKMISGQPTKAIAYSLEISSRTVDRRRISIFEKLAAKSLAELAMMYVEWSRSQGHFQSSH